MHEEIAVDNRKRQALEAPMAPSGPDGPTHASAVFEALKNVNDPELGINIVDLGLVYDVAGR